MLKYTTAEITFAEVPDEITLCINISNCPCHCEGCHSSYLAEDIGALLDDISLDLLIKGNEGITCVSFMGGDSDPQGIDQLAAHVRKFYNLKVAWYSGRQALSKKIDIGNFDYIKLGPYKKECGPLNCRTTNQRFYKVIHADVDDDVQKIIDITYKFWEHEIKDKSKKD